MTVDQERDISVTVEKDLSEAWGKAIIADSFVDAANVFCNAVATILYRAERKVMVNETELVRLKSAARDVLASADTMMLFQWTPPEFLRVCEILGLALGIKREDWKKLP